MIYEELSVHGLFSLLCIPCSPTTQYPQWIWSRELVAVRERECDRESWTSRHRLLVHRCNISSRVQAIKGVKDNLKARKRYSTSRCLTGTSELELNAYTRCLPIFLALVSPTQLKRFQTLGDLESKRERESEREPRRTAYVDHTYRTRNATRECIFYDCVGVSTPEGKYESVYTSVYTTPHLQV